MIFDTSGTHCMVDLETLDTVPGGVIISIGAVLFNAEQVIPDSEFYTILDAHSCADAGLTTNIKTVEWWSTQSKEACKAFIQSMRGPADPLEFGLGKFSGYLDRFDPVGIWGQWR